MFCKATGLAFVVINFYRHLPSGIQQWSWQSIFIWLHQPLISLVSCLCNQRTDYSSVQDWCHHICHDENNLFLSWDVVDSQDRFISVSHKAYMYPMEATMTSIKNTNENQIKPRWDQHYKQIDPCMRIVWRNIILTNICLFLKNGNKSKA